MSDKWISVTDKLPEMEQRVLLFNGNKHHPIVVGSFDAITKHGNRFSVEGFSLTSNMNFEPSHWMPLPESPKE